MNDAARLLAAYDDQLRTTAEAVGALAVRRHGPLRLITFPGGRGFVTYRDLGGADAAGIRRLVADALEHFSADAAVGQVEWKTRAHDRTPGLDESLREHGFSPDEPESIMIGEARALAIDIALPAGVSLRRVTEPTDVRAMGAMQADVFGRNGADWADETPALLARLACGDGLELWVAESGGAVIGAGRLEPVVGSEFAGIWGGAMLEPWRGRGIYRALTAARARSAVAMGKTLINSDSTEYSRPILERAGLIKVSSTTPYRWRRGRSA